jgi:hypothetical protein
MTVDAAAELMVNHAYHRTATRHDGVLGLVAAVMLLAGAWE